METDGVRPVSEWGRSAPIVPSAAAYARGPSAWRLLALGAACGIGAGGCAVLAGMLCGLGSPGWALICAGAALYVLVVGVTL